MAKKCKKKKGRLRLITVSVIVEMMLLEMVVIYFCVGWFYDSRRLTYENTTEVVATVESVHLHTGYGKRGSNYIDFYTDSGVYQLTFGVAPDEREWIKNSIKEGDELIFTVRKSIELLGPYDKTETYGVKSEDTIYYPFNDAVKIMNFRRPGEVLGCIIVWLIFTFLVLCYGVLRWDPKR